jgi:hypothetical protein
MNDCQIPTLVAGSRIGSEYIKLKNGSLVKWKSFDEKTQTFEFESAGGKLCEVHQRETSIPTANEEVEFLVALNRK